jgi:hypothetical protein
VFQITAKRQERKWWFQETEGKAVVREEESEG